MKAKYKNALLFLFFLITLAFDMCACLTTFINDKHAKVMIYNENNNTIIPIMRNERRRFGSPDEHAHFSIFVQQPKNKYFYRAYECKQNECGKTGNIQLKFSDIENGSGSTDLFTIIQGDPHVSMVNSLPMMKKHCGACIQE